MLAAYSKRDIQHARGILNGCYRDGLDVRECLGFLDRWINAPQVKNPCPDCKEKGFLVEMRKAITAPKNNRDEFDKLNADLNIVVCPKCRHSEVK